MHSSWEELRDVRAATPVPKASLIWVVLTPSVLLGREAPIGLLPVVWEEERSPGSATQC